jgi:hypothetical protein
MELKDSAGDPAHQRRHMWRSAEAKRAAMSGG